MPLTLLIPELLWPEPEDRATQDDLACPALETLLARAGRGPARSAATSYEAALCDAAGLPENAPYAALRRLGESGGPEGANEASGANTAGDWLAVDPVHLRFLQERLVLADPTQLELADDEAQALIAGFNRELAAYGRFHLGAAGRWYLEPADPALAGEHRAPPLSAVAGRSVERLLPSLGEAQAQRRLQNAAQMLLHEHPVNRAREATGRMTVNALWLWGGGPLPSDLTLPFDAILSDDPLARGLAHAAGVPARARPADAAALLGQRSRLAAEARTAHPLVVLDDLATAVQYESGEAYRAALARLDAEWFAPLLAALRDGTLRGELTLLAPTVYGRLEWRLARPASWAFWRRPKPLATWARELAELAPPSHQSISAP